MGEPLLTVRHLKKYFPVKTGLLQRTTGQVKAVDDISLTIQPGETFGLVGESGSGKSTVGRSIVRLTEKTDGDILFKGTDLYTLPEEELRRLRPKLQMIFQDPYGSLNPRIRVGDAIGEALLDHGLLPKGRFVTGCWRCWLRAGYPPIISIVTRTSSPAGSANGLGSRGR